MLAPGGYSFARRSLGDGGVLVDLTIREFPVHFLSLESDLLSLAHEDAFEELYPRNDHTSIFYSGRSSMTIHRSYGLFPRRIRKGDYSRRLADALIRIRGQQGASDSFSSPFSRFSLPLSSVWRVWFMGQLGSTTGIIQGFNTVTVIMLTAVPGTAKIEVDSSLVGSPPQSGITTAHSPSTWNLGDNLRDTNFAIVGNRLNKVPRRLNDAHEAKASVVEIAYSPSSEDHETYQIRYLSYDIGTSAE
ncbi:hypothetical protein HOY80DRAFT_1090750 [Tuber brumale]|nr:hypothetical protein HOY80DRAFT_1090750 [Tuber brumale]